jgi:methylmalonyl-CoA/ethylmalonyl-CoA epimerase
MDASETAASIAALASADPATRARGAGSLYEQGAALAALATGAWRATPELAALLTGSPTVGVAVREQTFERIRAANGLPPLADVPPDQDAREFELHFPSNISLDVLTTREPGGSGAIARFLDRRGEGIQQVELLVTDVDRATALLRQYHGLEPIYPATRPGAGSTRVNFFLVPIPAGPKVLIELVETSTHAGH